MYCVMLSVTYSTRPSVFTTNRKPSSACKEEIRRRYCNDEVMVHDFWKSHKGCNLHSCLTMINYESHLLISIIRTSSKIGPTWSLDNMLGFEEDTSPCCTAWLLEPSCCLKCRICKAKKKENNLIFYKYWILAANAICYKMTITFKLSRKIYNMK